jgi:hypothetical protein
VQLTQRLTDADGGVLADLAHEAELPGGTTSRDAAGLFGSVCTACQLDHASAARSRPVSTSASGSRPGSQAGTAGGHASPSGYDRQTNCSRMHSSCTQGRMSSLQQLCRAHTTDEALPGVRVSRAGCRLVAVRAAKGEARLRFVAELRVGACKPASAAGVCSAKRAEATARAMGDIHAAQSHAQHVLPRTHSIGSRRRQSRMSFHPDSRDLANIDVRNLRLHTCVTCMRCMESRHHTAAPAASQCVRVARKVELCSWLQRLTIVFGLAL